MDKATGVQTGTRVDDVAIVEQAAIRPDDAAMAAVVATLNGGSKEQPAPTPASGKKLPAIGAEIVGDTLTIMFSDGRVLELDAAKCDSEIRQTAMMAGFKSKLVDAGAISRNTTTGASASLADKYDAVKEVYERITAIGGAWNVGRKAGEGTGGTDGLLRRAIMELKGKDAATVTAYLAGKTPDERKALKKNPKVAAIMLRLASEQADSTIDTDALLDEI